jgi:alanyl aminopeptidase
VSNAWAQVRAGALAPGAYLDVLPLLDRETSRYVIDQLIGSLYGMSDALVEDDARPKFRAYVTARLAAHKRKLGWQKQDDKETDDVALLRRSVLSAMSELAEDESTFKEADVYARQWLDDPTRVPGDTAQVAVEIASRRAGPERLDQLRAALKRARTPEERVIAIRAMGALGDPALLQKALDLALGDELKISDMRYLFGSALGHRASRPVVVAWEKASWDKLRAKLPGSLSRGLSWVVGGMCTRAEREDAAAFFTPRLKDVEGAQRPLAEALEGAGLCVALREHGAAETTKYFKRR